MILASLCLGKNLTHCRLKRLSYPLPQWSPQPPFSSLWYTGEGGVRHDFADRRVEKVVSTRRFSRYS